MTDLACVDGTVEACGQHTLNREAGVSYTFVRFVTIDGNTVSLKNVAADNEINSYLGVGKTGRYCFYQYKAANILCGYKTDGRTHIASEVDDPVVVLLRAQRYAAKANLWVGLLLSLLLVGIPFVLYALAQLASLRVSRPANDDIGRALAAGIPARLPTG